MEVGGTGRWGQKRKWGVESANEAGKRSEVKGIRDGVRELHGNRGGRDRKLGSEAEVGGRNFVGGGSQFWAEVLNFGGVMGVS